MKKVLSLFLSVLMLTSVVAAVDLSAYADTVASGTCGDNVTWELDEDGTLTISGTGEMYDDFYCYSSTNCSIPWYTYRDNILNVVIGDDVTSIGRYAFYNCSNLTNVSLPNGLTSIGYLSFHNCTNLLDIIIPNSVITISTGAFEYCTSLTNINIPDSVKEIGGGAFYGCSGLVSVVIGNSVSSILSQAFEGCTSLTDLTIGTGVISIGEYAFWECTSLIDLVIPEGVTSIGNSTFQYCSNLESVTIPISMESIGHYAFYNCDNITNVYYNGYECGWGKISFGRFNENLTSASIYYAGGSEHIWNDGEITKETSCDEEGEKTYTCTICGQTQTEVIAKLDHTWNTGVITKEATSTASGVKTYTCTVCGATKTESVAYTGSGSGSTSGSTSSSTTCTTHTWDSGKTTTKATCTKTGVKTYTCTVCGATKTETIAKTAHTYKNVITKATTSKNGKITPKCSVCGKTKTATTIYKIKSMSLSTSSYTYNGKAKKPSVTVKDSKGNKISSKYYTVKYINQSTGKTVSSMKNPGKYYVKVTFKTRYSGSIKKAVTIKPKKTSIKSIKASSKGFTVKWSKVSTQNTGYQVQYSTSKSFKSAKTATIKKTGTTSKKVSKLRAKKKYYVRVRTYKTVKINGKSTKIYSSWSSVKGVTTKK